MFWAYDQIFLCTNDTLSLPSDIFSEAASQKDLIQLSVVCQSIAYGSPASFCGWIIETKASSTHAILEYFGVFLVRTSIEHPFDIYIYIYIHNMYIYNIYVFMI